MKRPSAVTLIRTGLRTLRAADRRRRTALALTVLGIVACTWAATLTLTLASALASRFHGDWSGRLCRA